MGKKKREEIANPFIDETISEVVDELKQETEVSEEETETSDELIADTSKKSEKETEKVEEEYDDSKVDIVGVDFKGREYVAEYLARQWLELKNLKACDTSKVGYIAETLSEIGICHEGTRDDIVYFQVGEYGLGGVKIKKMEASEFIAFYKV